MKRPLALAIVSLGVIGVVFLALWLSFSNAESRHAVVIAAGVAVPVQGIAVTLLFLAKGQRVVAAWGAGAGIRLLSLVLFLFVVVPRLGLPAAPAAVSLALFLFVTTLIEPLFLKA